MGGKSIIAIPNCKQSSEALGRKDVNYFNSVNQLLNGLFVPSARRSLPLKATLKREKAKRQSADHRHSTNFTFRALQLHLCIYKNVIWKVVLGDGRAWMLLFLQ